MNIVQVHTHYIDLDRLTAGATIVDGGACEGAFIGELQDAVPGVPLRYIAVEPDPRNADRLRRAVPGAVVIQAALVGEGSSPEREFTQIGGLPEWGNLFGRWTERGTIKVFRVPTKTLAAVCAEQKVERIAYLKLDIEGAEREVLETLSPDLAGRIDQIAVEVHEHQWLLADAAKRLETLGFTIAKCDPKYVELLGVR